MKAIAKVPADADPLVRVVCYLRRQSIGAAWLDDVSVRPITDYPPVDRVFTYAFRNATAGEPLRVGAKLDLQWAGLKPEAAPLRLQVRGEAGKVLATLKPTKLADKLAEFSVDASKLRPGEYALACGIEAPGGKLTGERTCTFKRLEHLIGIVDIDTTGRYCGSAASSRSCMPRWKACPAVSLDSGRGPRSGGYCLISAGARLHGVAH